MVFCAAWKESPTDLSRGIKTPLSQISRWFSTQLPVCTHLTAQRGMQHQFREPRMDIFLSLSAAHCPGLHCNLSLGQSFQALLFYFPWQKCHIASSIPLLSSSGPCWVLFLLWISPISVHQRSIHCEVNPPSMWFILLREEAVKCWHFETPHVL